MIERRDEVTTIIITSCPEESDPIVCASDGASDGASAVPAIAVYFHFLKKRILLAMKTDDCS